MVVDCTIITEIETDHWNSVRIHIISFHNTMSTKAELLFTEKGCNLRKIMVQQLHSEDVVAWMSARRYLFRLKYFVFFRYV